jgi:hypothetical protein
LCIATHIEHRTRDVGLYFTLIRKQVACEPVFFVSIIELLLAVSGNAAGKSIRVLESAFCRFAFIRMLLPYAGAYSSVSGMKPDVLPWG